MHHTNHYYGHAHLMARYAGLADWPHPPRIWGYLQHGWNLHHGFDPAADLVPGLPKFVWSERPRDVGHRLGLRDYHVIGAPWAYLLALEPELGAAEAEQRGTIFYPFHGWERQSLVGDHRRLAAVIRDHESGPVTICLYWLEYRQPGTREAYERAGFRVITHGRRGSWRRGTDVCFLHRQLAELRRHRRVASNRLSTAVLYGASIGRETGVYGDPMRLVDEADLFGGVARLRREWPEMHAPAVPREVATEVARDELGLDRRREPGEILDLFGWHHECAGHDRLYRTPLPLGLDDARAQIRWLDQEVQMRDAELRRTRESTSYRLGNALVRPARRVRERVLTPRVRRG